MLPKRWISHVTRHGSQPPTVLPNILSNLRIFDPDNLEWNEKEEKLVENPQKIMDIKEDEIVTETIKTRTEICEENRTDGHAPIKWALSALMHGLQQCSSKSKSFSDLNVTLFNFHSTKFAERLLSRNVSSVVIVESSHKFSKSAKKFAQQFQNVDAYRADIPSLLGVGRKKTASLPRNLLYSRKIWDAEEAALKKPECLNSDPNTMKDVLVPLSINEHYVPKKPNPNSYLLGVIPTAAAQRSILESLTQHALLHHTSLDLDTIFRYSEANLLTFLHCSILSQILCSTDPKYAFLSHHHRRNSSVFNKLFDVQLIRRSSAGKDFEGYSMRSFHPELPTPKKLTHEKKLAEIGLVNDLQYPVRIAPRTEITINQKYPENLMDLLAFAHFMDLIGKNPNTKPSEIVIKSLFPQSTISSDHFTEKIGMMSDLEIESVFEQVKEELMATPGFSAFSQSLKIKRSI